MHNTWRRRSFPAFSAGSPRDPLPMMRRRFALCVTGLLAATVLATVQAQSPHTSSAAIDTPTRRFELTVDSIMRGPAIVGYPPSGRRWGRWPGRG